MKRLPLFAIVATSLACFAFPAIASAQFLDNTLTPDTTTVYPGQSANVSWYLYDLGNDDVNYCTSTGFDITGFEEYWSYCDDSTENCYDGSQWDEDQTGTFNTGPLYQTTSYSLTCYTPSYYGLSNEADATINVVPWPSCTSSPNDCGQTNSGQLVNGSCDAGPPADPWYLGQQCSASSVAGTNYGTYDCNANCSVGAPSVPSNYGQSCTSSPNSCGQTNTGSIQGDGSCSAQAPSNAGCAPVCTLSASPSTILAGDTDTLTWSCSNATSCTSAGGFSTGGAANNSTGVVVTPTSTSDYQISCTGPAGTASSNVSTVTVQQPSAYITAAPERISQGESASVSWSATNVDSCSVTGTDGYSSGTLSGPTIATTTVSRTLTNPATYTITCPSQSVSSSVTVNVVPSFQEF